MVDPYQYMLSCLLLFCDPVAQQTPLSMEFSRQEYWRGLPFPLIGDLPNPVIEPASPVPPAFQELSHLGSPLSVDVICKYFLPLSG